MTFFFLCSLLSALRSLQGSRLTICLILLANPNHVVQRSQLFALYFTSYYAPSRDRRLSTPFCPYLDLVTKTLEDCYTEHSLAVLRYLISIGRIDSPNCGLGQCCAVVANLVLVCLEMASVEIRFRRRKETLPRSIKSREREQTKQRVQSSESKAARKDGQ